MYCSKWFVSAQFKYAHAMLHVHWGHPHITLINAPISCLSNTNVRHTVADWKSWAYTDRSYQ
eukprot:349849-Pelagomonas_calceolata.AAC.1